MVQLIFIQDICRALLLYGNGRNIAHYNQTMNLFSVKYWDYAIPRTLETAPLFNRCCFYD